MTTTRTLRQLGLFEARVPRYTSYPPANHFGEGVGAADMQTWLEAVSPEKPVSIYVHVPYCRRLCWFCACRTQGTATDRPLAAYVTRLKAEMALLDRHLPARARIGQVHLGGGTPTLLPPDLLDDLVGALKDLRPWTGDAAFSVEIDPTEIDAERVGTLARHGMTRASIGVQDFDPLVQEAIGRVQGYDQTRDVVDLLRDAGIGSLNMDLLYGLPYQDVPRLSDSVQRVLSLTPDRVALYGYAHVPWMARRQSLIPADALPDAEARLDLFETARRLFVWDGYLPVGIDHFARPGDGLARAVEEGRLRRNFQGYTDDTSEVLIGLGASAISRFPQGFAQNHATSSRYAAAVEAGDLPVARGHALSRDDRLRADMIEALMCRFRLDFADLARRHRVDRATLDALCAPILEQFGDHCARDDDGLRLTRDAALIARLAANLIDAYAVPEGRHSRAL